MRKRMGRFGVGPKINFSAIAFAALACLATRRWPDVCLVRAAPYEVFLGLGLLLLAVGIPTVVYAFAGLMRAYESDRLVTSGLYSVCRHPLYAIDILVILPGLTLLTASWPVMLTPLVAYAVFRRVIRVEEDHLSERYGDAYREYRARVNRLFPTVRR